MSKRTWRWVWHYAFAALMGAALAVSGLDYTDSRWWLLFAVALAWGEVRVYFAELERTP